MKYLTKLKVALMKINWKLCIISQNLITGLLQQGLGDLLMPITGNPIPDKND